MTLSALEVETPWSNKAELYIGLMKEAIRNDMREANSTMVFWDYCGCNAHTGTTGEEGDISSLCQYGW